MSRAITKDWLKQIGFTKKRLHGENRVMLNLQENVLGDAQWIELAYLETACADFALCRLADEYIDEETPEDRFYVTCRSTDELVNLLRVLGRDVADEQSATQKGGE